VTPINDRALRHFKFITNAHRAVPVLLVASNERHLWVIAMNCDEQRSLWCLDGAINDRCIAHYEFRVNSLQTNQQQAIEFTITDCVRIWVTAYRQRPLRWHAL